MKMTMRKLLAILATLAIMCTVLPLGTLFSAVADENVIENTNFDDGELHGWSSSSTISVEDGALKFECTKDWANVYKYANGMKANTNYLYTFKAKANMNKNMNIKINDNWAKDTAKEIVDLTTEWQEFSVVVNSGDFSAAAILMFSANEPASTGLVYYIDDIVIAEYAGEEPEVPAEPSNDGYIVNGDFETGDIAPWDNLWGSCPKAEVIEGGKDSKYAVSIVSGQWKHVRQTGIAVEANTDYKITAWAKDAKDMSLLVKDGGDSKDLKNVGVNAGSEWTEFTAEFNTGDYTSIIFSLMGASEDAYGIFDSIVMEKIGGGETPDEPEEPVADNILKNGDFTNGIDGWSSSGGTVLAADNGALHADFNESWGFINAGTYNLKANTEYKLTFKAKAINGGGVTPKMNKSDWSGTVVQQGMEFTAEWAAYEWTFTTDDNTSLMLFFQSGCPADAGQEVWLDDVVLVEVIAEPEAPVVENILNNGDFTDGIDGWSSSGGTVLAADNGALHADFNESWGFINAGTYNLKANTEYKLTFKAKAINGGGVTPKMNKSDWSGTVVQEGMNFTEEWAAYEWTFTTGSDTSLMLFFQSGCSADAGQEVWLDDVVLYEVISEEPDAPSAGETILDTNFDDGELGNWASGSEISNEDGALKFSVTKDWGNIYQALKVKANTDYVVSFKAKAAKGGSAWVKFHKGDWTGDIVQADLKNVGSDWKEYSFTLNTGDNTDINVLIQYAGYGADGEIFWFDDITIATVGGEEPDAPTTSDVLVNGGFENGSEGWELSSSATIVDDAHTGKGALQLSDVGMWAGAALQTVPVKAETNYVIKMWYKRDVGAKPFNLFIMNGENNANLKVIEGQNWFNDGPGDWTERTIIVYTADATSMTIKWSAECANDGVLLIDDMQVYPEGQEPGAPEEQELIKNSGFETGDLTNWNNLWNGCNVSFLEPGRNGSKYAVEIAPKKQWSQTRQDGIPVEPNTDYVIIAYVRNSKDMAIVVKSGDDTTDLNTSDAGDGLIPDDSTNTWKKVVVEFNTGKDKNGNAIDPIDSVCVLLISPGANGGSAEFDDVQMYKKGEEPTEGPTGPIQNAGFETGDLTNWNNLWNSCTVSFEPGRSNSKYALMLETSGQWQQVRQDGIAVEPNTDYVLIGYVKNPYDVNFVVKTGNDKANIADYPITNDMSNVWVRCEVPFNSGSETEVCVLMISREVGGYGLFDDVQIYKKGEEPGDEPDEPIPTEGPMELDSYGVAANRPVTPEANLILNGSFEDAEGGQWQSILGDVLTVVDDETAPEGNKSLYFNTSGVDYSDKAVFYVDVEPNTDYVFSAWVKGAFISDTNRFKATFGVIDYKNRFLTYSDHVFSNKDRQIVPPCWDNEWHLRSVSFNSGVNIKVGIAITGGYSQMWLDGIALFKVEDGIKYADERQVHYIIASPLYAEEGGCAESDSLIPDVNMDGAESKEFWSSAEGYQNGFLSFAENKYEYGTSLKYTASDKACGTHAIKWIDVQPNTKYTFSVDMRIIEGGNGRLALLDGKLRECYSFLMIDFDKEGYGSDWFTVAIEFDSGEFDRIGIAVVDGGGEVLIDNMRLFESAKRIEGGVKDDYVKPPYSFDDPTDSPDTGVTFVGAALAMALVPASAAVALKLRRKEEDEE